jgi:hypothetical protein
MKGNALMRRFILAALALLIASTAADAGGIPRLFSSHPREAPKVADGITIASKLTNVDATNVNYNVSLTNAFTTTSGSATVTVAHTSHGKTVGKHVVFSQLSSSSIGGLNIEGGYYIVTVPDANSYTITHASLASGNAGPTGSATASYGIALDDGKLRFKCTFSHLLYDDPILKPQQSGSTHLHLFFGNASTTGHSTYESLRNNTSGSTCAGDELNGTAYWMPAMIDSLNSVVQIPEYFEWYYVSGRRQLIDYTSTQCPSGVLQAPDNRPIACPEYAMKRLERGMKAVFGFNPLTGALPTTYTDASPTTNTSFHSLWGCQGVGGGAFLGSAYRYLHHRSNSSLGLTSNGSCVDNGQIVARVNSPPCWNGEQGGDVWTNFAWNGNDGAGSLGGGNNICPATHPYRFPQFTVIAAWNYTGPISTVADWYLSSDRHSGADYENGESFHWDMMWAWNDDVLEHLFGHVLGLFPSSTPTGKIGGPYVFSDAGDGQDGSCHPTNTTANSSCFYVGSPYIRNTNVGGLGIDCSRLGMSGACHMNLTTNGIYDTTLPIPAEP